MKQWLGRFALVAVGALLGALVLPNQWQQDLREQTSAVKSDALERAALWAASQSDRLDARASLFVEFPGIVPAIQRGGAFGG